MLAGFIPSYIVKFDGFTINHLSHHNSHFRYHYAKATELPADAFSCHTMNHEQGYVPCCQDISTHRELFVTHCKPNTGFEKATLWSRMCFISSHSFNWKIYPRASVGAESEYAVRLEDRGNSSSPVGVYQL